MRPWKLTMQAFGSYGKKTTIDFADPNQNLFLITGDTGAGKTTIFDAIVFAIYGEASSGSNKKDGFELQSQFAEYTVDPYVELTFSEMSGGDEQFYRVRRTPRHLRPLKRGNGQKEEKEQVSLIMPDGTEYVQKETERKLEELIGLTKDQFMQVGMIAQGEFMELLRAKSDQKKLIFRKLFHTEVYQDIVDELGRRRKEMQSAMAQMRTACQTEIAHTTIPDDFDSSEEMEALKQRIISAEKMNVAELEGFQEYLKELCGILEMEQTKLCKIFEKAGRERDERRDAAIRGQTLEQSFIQKQQAEEILAQCAQQEEEFGRIRDLIRNIDAAYEIQNVHLRYEEAAERVKKMEEALETRRQRLPEEQARCERLSRETDAAKAEQELWQKKYEEAQLLVEETSEAADIWEQLRKEQRRAVGMQEEYAVVREQFQQKNIEYVSLHNAFLDEQAGVLAQEKLRPGEPCPVCGSLEHPHPRRISEKYHGLTRQMVDALKEETDRLQGTLTEKSTEAHAALELLREKEIQFEARVQKLHERMEKMAESENLRMVCQTTPVKLKEQKEFEDLRAAREALRRVQEIKEAKETAYVRSEREAQKAKSAREETEILIRQYTEQLPELQSEQSTCAEKYRRVLQEKAFLESLSEKGTDEHQITGGTWKWIVEHHRKSDVRELQQKLDYYNRRKASAEGTLEAARKLIGKQERPNIEELQRQMEESEVTFRSTRSAYERVKEELRVNQSVQNALMPKMEERGRLLKEYTRVDSLYNRLAGKITGARMDIETFVQRYYLDRILHHANARFFEMTAGQYELRMVSTENAGVGKNRGLDLMVYSNVTGKEREIRTLSGGESFMAALALALGMSDQIQESSASIHLDVMFIDEGFGSLDNNSRDQAVKVLQRMAGGSKLIGLISHVTELKQVIEDQLIVSKDEEGSKVRWQIS
ncbi:MAG: SMC family ATPase [Eubacteriales bacterium]|nr:SMC family ATPase [Eubacteriales bacterium]